MNNFNKEDLLLELPDFIEGKINDNEKISAINSLINSDSDFRSEFEELSETIAFSRNTQYSQPYDFYFNTMLTNIREKIEIETDVSKLSFFEKFRPAFLRFVLPVFILGLILTGIYSTGVFDGNVVESDNIVSTETQNEKFDSIKETNIPSEIESNELSNIPATIESRTQANNQFDRTDKKTINNAQINSVENVSSIEEYLDDMDNLSGLYYDYLNENEFTDLTKEEEDLIIESLNQIQL